MKDITIYLYGLIPGKFLDTVQSFSENSSLETIEQQIINQYGKEIPSEYKIGNCRLNHKLVLAGNEQGEALNYNSDISAVKEIWFIIPLAGG